MSDSGGDGRSGTDGFCANGDALLGADSVAVSPTAAGIRRVALLQRGREAGARRGYRQAHAGGCIKNYERADRCRAGFGLEGTSGVVVSEEGKNVYVTADKPGSVSVYSRDANKGDLQRVMCVSESGYDGLCTDGTALLGASSVSSRPTGARCS